MPPPIERSRFSEISSKSPDIFTITFKRTTAPWATHPQLLPVDGAQRKGKRMFAEPTFIVSLSGLCGFILVVEDGAVDA